MSDTVQQIAWKPAGINLYKIEVLALTTLYNTMAKLSTIKNVEEEIATTRKYGILVHCAL